MQNAAAEIAWTGTTKYEHNNLPNLHWLPVSFFTDSKISLLAFDFIQFYKQNKYNNKYHDY